MKRTLSWTRQARCPPGAGRGGGLSACKGGGPTACPTAVYRRMVKRARCSGVRNFTPKRQPLVSRDPCAGRTGPRATRVLPTLGPRPRGPGRPCPAGGRPPARGERAGPRGFLGDPANDERRLPFQQKLEPRDPMKAAVRPVSRGLRNVCSHPFCDRGPGSPEATRILRSGCHSVPNRRPAPRSRNSCAISTWSSTRGFRKSQ
jgi:hypothetical protein